jgi:hypothetical protein
MYLDLGAPWKIHDELFYGYGYDVPSPHFMQNAKRAVWCRIPQSELSQLDRIRESAVKRKAEDAAHERSCRQRLEGNDPAKEVCYQDLRHEMKLAATFPKPPPRGYTYTEWYNKMPRPLNREPVVRAEVEAYRQELLAGMAGA